jgi:hypothetical protein
MFTNVSLLSLKNNDINLVKPSGNSVYHMTVKDALYSLFRGARTRRFITALTTARFDP